MSREQQIPILVSQTIPTPPVASEVVLTTKDNKNTDKAVCVYFYHLTVVNYFSKNLRPKYKSTLFYNIDILYTFMQSIYII